MNIKLTRKSIFIKKFLLFGVGITLIQALIDFIVGRKFEPIVYTSLFILNGFIWGISRFFMYEENLKITEELGKLKELGLNEIIGKSFNLNLIKKINSSISKNKLQSILFLQYNCCL